MLDQQFRQMECIFHSIHFLLNQQLFGNNTWHNQYHLTINKYNSQKRLCGVIPARRDDGSFNDIEKTVSFIQCSETKLHFPIVLTSASAIKNNIAFNRILLDEINVNFFHPISFSLTSSHYWKIKFYVVNTINGRTNNFPGPQ